ncbi:MAG: uroporphyrinogen-III C-methyltransferase [Chloroflexi bacterium]|nr:MAG: uroporphyrinogen-III C-methyltransferase [Chloroflexota bacterium]
MRAHSWRLPSGPGSSAGWAASGGRSPRWWAESAASFASAAFLSRNRPRCTAGSSARTCSGSCAPATPTRQRRARRFWPGRARELLADADHVLHDALISPATLELCGPQAILEPVGKRGGSESAEQDAITARMIELAHAGRVVVRLKGGDPFVFGRGGEEMRDLLAAGVDVVVVPGVTSALAAGESIGVPATLRGVASSVAITTAQGPESMTRLRDLAAASDTLVVMMARANLAEIAAEIGSVVGRARPAALVSKATWPDQRSVEGSIGDIARMADTAHIDAPATLIVGDVVSALTARALQLAAI